MKRFISWTLLTAIAFSTGCAGIDKDWKKKLPWSPESKIKSSQFETPAHMLAIWSPDVLSQSGKPPTRGFGGRIYFYDEKNHAVPVEGQLVVYAYDDVHNDHQAGRPQRKFAFTPEQLTKHYSNSELGASYSIWIPWDAVGGDQCKISLVPVFTASSGQVVMGQQALNVLPGRTPPESQHQLPQVSSLLHADGPQTSHPPSSDGVQAAAFANDAAPTQAPPRLRTSTIRLTPSLQRRLAQIPVNSDTSFAQSPRQEVPNAAGGTNYQVLANTTGMPSWPAPMAALPEPPISSPPSAHSERSKFPVRGGLGGRSGPLAPWTPPYPVTPPSALHRPPS